MNIKRLMEIGCYRGLRHRRNLPVARAANEHQRAHAQGAAQGGRRRQEDQLERGATGTGMAKVETVRDRAAPGEAQAAEEVVQEAAARSASCTMASCTFRLPSTTPSLPSPTPRARCWAWSSAGGIDSRLAQGHPVRGHAGAINAGHGAKAFGSEPWTCAVKGPGAGRESAIRALRTSVGLEIKSIRDVTPIPHNGCRPPKRRRV